MSDVIWSPHLPESTTGLVRFPTLNADADQAPSTIAPPMYEPKDSPRAPSVFKKAADWMSENPGPTVCYGIGVAGLAVISSPLLVSSPLVGAVGVAANGVAANSAGGLLAVLAGAGQAVASGAVVTGFGGGLVWKRFIGEKKDKQATGPTDDQRESETHAIQSSGVTGDESRGQTERARSAATQDHGHPTDAS